jgi:hypothetical protein
MNHDVLGLAASFAGRIAGPSYASVRSNRLVTVKVATSSG